MIRFKCWFFGHQPARTWVYEQTLVGLYRFERALHQCSRCGKTLAIEWDQV